MELLPLLIIVGGILYSAIASKAKKKDEGDRDVDPSKLERQGNSAPRRRQPNSNEDTSNSGGFFGDLKRDFQREYERTTGESSSYRGFGRSGDKEDSVDMKKDAEERIKDLQNSPSSSGQSSSNRQSQSTNDQRAAESRRAAYSKGDKTIEQAETAEAIGRDSIEDVSYESGDDETQTTNKDKKRTANNRIRKGDLTFDKRAVVNGVIFSEILGKPKSKR